MRRTDCKSESHNRKVWKYYFIEVGSQQFNTVIVKKVKFYSNFYYSRLKIRNNNVRLSKRLNKKATPSNSDDEEVQVIPKSKFQNNSKKVVIVISIISTYCFN